jgi:hypothetical protein
MTYDLSTTAGNRMLLQVQKTATTSPEYPRDTKTIKKHPLA